MRGRCNGLRGETDAVRRSKLRRKHEPPSHRARCICQPGDVNGGACLQLTNTKFHAGMLLPSLFVAGGSKLHLAQLLSPCRTHASAAAARESQCPLSSSTIHVEFEHAFHEDSSIRSVADLEAHISYFRGRYSST